MIGPSIYIHSKLRKFEWQPKLVELFPSLKILWTSTFTSGVDNVQDGSNFLSGGLVTKLVAHQRTYFPSFFKINFELCIVCFYQLLKNCHCCGRTADFIFSNACIVAEIPVFCKNRWCCGRTAVVVAELPAVWQNYQWVGRSAIVMANYGFVSDVL